jgi:diacylglycerol kinase (ATP)
MDPRPVPPLVVVNPLASRISDPGRRDWVIASVAEAVLARTGRTPTVVDTTLDDARAALATAAAGSSPLVAVLGGDGTLREAAALLAGSGVPMAIVPAGTGNVFAAALGIPRRIDAAVALIGRGRPSPVDVGRASWGPTRDGVPGEEAGSQVFVVACGLGFDARVMAAATTDLKRRLGFGAYVVAAVREATRLKPVRLVIEADGDVHDLSGFVVLLANCGQLIPGLVGPRHPIDPTDGLLDAIVVRAANVPGGIAGAVEVLLAGEAPPTHGARGLRLRASRVRVVADPPEPIQVDGDPHAADWLAASVLPRAMTILRP